MKRCLPAAALILAVSACQVPGVKEVEEKLNSMSGQVSQLRTSGQDMGARLEQLEDMLRGIEIPDTGDLQLPDIAGALQGFTDEIDTFRLQIQDDLLENRGEIDSLMAVIAGLELEIESLSGRITTLENRPVGGTTTPSTGSTGRGDTSGGRGGTTGGTTGSSR